MKKILLRKTAALILVAIIGGVSIAFFAETVLGRDLELSYPNLPNPAGGDPITLTSDTSLPQLLNYFFTFFVMIGGLIAFGVIVFAGFQFMISGANPAMRSQAMNRIRNVIFGLVLLLSSYIIFNTINPELVLLYTPGVGPQIPPPPEFKTTSGIFDSVDYETLRYGGVIIFDDDEVWMDGATDEKSETVLHDINDIGDENFITVHDGSDRGIMSVKILGDCSVSLTKDEWAKVSEEIDPPGGVFDKLGGDFTNFKDSVQGINFIKKNCVGHSVKVFESIIYNDGQSSVNENGSLVLLGSEPNLNSKSFVNSKTTTKVAKNIRSIRFAFNNSSVPPTDADYILKVMPDLHIIRVEDSPLKLGLCTEKNANSGCLTFSTSTPNIPAHLDPNIATTTVSVKFDNPKYRQAGVILYDEDFDSGRHEIFIASDKNLNPSFMGNDKASAIRIIGEYRVTLYVKPTTSAGVNFDPSPSEGWVRFDNTNPSDPRVTTWALRYKEAEDLNGDRDTIDTLSEEIKKQDLNGDGDALDVDVSESAGNMFAIGESRTLDKTGNVLSAELEDFCVKFTEDDLGQRTIEAGCETSFDNRISAIEIQTKVNDFKKLFPTLDKTTYCVNNTPPFDGDGDDNWCRL